MSFKGGTECRNRWNETAWCSTLSFHIFPHSVPLLKLTCSLIRFIFQEAIPDGWRPFQIVGTHPRRLKVITDGWRPFQIAGGHSLWLEAIPDRCMKWAGYQLITRHFIHFHPLYYRDVETITVYIPIKFCVYLLSRLSRESVAC